MNLRGCLASSEAPYPPLRRPMPLPLAVRCASELWGEDQCGGASPVARLAEAARAGSQELMDKTAAFGSSLAKWGQGILHSTAQAFTEGSPTNREQKGSTLCASLRSRGGVGGQKGSARLQPLQPLLQASGPEAVEAAEQQPAPAAAAAAAAAEA